MTNIKSKMPFYKGRGNNKNPCMDLEALIDKPDFVAQTANGTAKPMGTGWNKDYRFGPLQEVDPEGPWQSGRSNRTGE